MKTIIQTLAGFFILILFFPSCNNEDFEYPVPDPDYPLVIEPLSETQQAEKLKLLNSIKDAEDQMEMDEFGFVTLTRSFNDSTNVDAKKIRDFAFEKLERYHSFFGYNEMFFNENQNMLAIKVDGFPTDYYMNVEENNDMLNTILQYQMEKYDSIIYGRVKQYKLSGFQFEHNEIGVILDYKNQSMTLSGYLFPEAYIPVQDAIPVSDAINIVLNDLIDYSAGEVFEFNIEQLKKSRKVILKRMVNGNYAFYLCWKIYIYKKYKAYYIDSQTGEIRKIYNYRHYI